MDIHLSYKHTNKFGGGCQGGIENFLFRREPHGQ